MLCYLDLNENEILKIIRDLNMRKARRRDDISIRMIKIFGQITITTINYLIS